MRNIHYINNNLNQKIANLSGNKFIVIDSNVHQLHDEYLQEILAQAQDYIIIEAMETHKNKASVESIYEMLLRNKANRHDQLIAIGGGLITDLAGYAAATFYRGMNLVYVSTTLLGQVDASIGGKVGYNMQNHKNIIGTFYEAHHIMLDDTFLATLTDRLFKEGLVEIIKHGLIKDKTIIDDLAQVADIKALRAHQQLVQQLIKKSLTVKENLINQDPDDRQHIRSLLNFGHTFGHAIELDNNVYHGEAIALGMLVETYQYPDIYQTIKDILEKFGCLKKIEDISLANIALDKKIAHQQIDTVFFTAIGQATIKPLDVNECIAQYEKNYQQLHDQLTYIDSQYEFYPTKLQGAIKVPPSKSQLHRYIIAAALAQQKTTLNNVTSLNDDVLTTLKAIKALKADYQYHAQTSQLTIEPHRGLSSPSTIEMNESGTTLRLLLPVLIHYLNKVSVKTHPSLSKRPMQPYYDLFKQNNIQISKPAEEHVTYQGTFQADQYVLSGQISSQFISGLLFLLPLLEHDTTLVIKDEIESLPYVHLTLATLEAFNIDVKVNDDYTKFTVKKQQAYQSKQTYDIEIDYSALAFWEVANALGSQVQVTNDTQTASLQGDYFIKQITSEHLTTIDLKNTPDLFPILCIYLTTTGGILTGINRLQYKESNRLEAMLSNLAKSDIEYDINDERLKITAGSFHGGLYETYHDHRIAMALIIASTIATGKIVLQEIKSINKSYPTFINTYRSLGGRYNEI